MFRADSVPELDARGTIKVWHETDHAVTCYRLSSHPETGVIVRNLECETSHTYDEIWPYPGDAYVYGDLDTYRFAVQDHELGWNMEDVLMLFGVPPQEYPEG